MVHSSSMEFDTAQYRVDSLFSRMNIENIQKTETIDSLLNWINERERSEGISNETGFSKEGNSNSWGSPAYSDASLNVGVSDMDSQSTFTHLISEEEEKKQMQKEKLNELKAMFQTFLQKKARNDELISDKRLEELELQLIEAEASAAMAKEKESEREREREREKKEEEEKRNMYQDYVKELQAECRQKDERIAQLRVAMETEENEREEERKREREKHNEKEFELKTLKDKLKGLNEAMLKMQQDCDKKEEQLKQMRENESIRNAEQFQADILEQRKEKDKKDLIQKKEEEEKFNQVVAQNLEFKKIIEVLKKQNDKMMKEFRLNGKRAAEEHEKETEKERENKKEWNNVGKTEELELGARTTAEMNEQQENSEKGKRSDTSSQKDEMEGKMEEEMRLILEGEELVMKHLAKQTDIFELNNFFDEISSLLSSHLTACEEFRIEHEGTLESILMLDEPVADEKKMPLSHLRRHEQIFKRIKEEMDALKELCKRKIGKKRNSNDYLEDELKSDGRSSEEEEVEEEEEEENDDENEQNDKDKKTPTTRSFLPSDLSESQDVTNSPDDLLPLIADEEKKRQKQLVADKWEMFVRRMLDEQKKSRMRDIWEERRLDEEKGTVSSEHDGFGKDGNDDENEENFLKSWKSESHLSNASMLSTQKSLKRKAVANKEASDEQSGGMKFQPIKDERIQIKRKERKPFEFSDVALHLEERERRWKEYWKRKQEKEEENRRIKARLVLETLEKFSTYPQLPVHLSASHGQSVHSNAASSSDLSNTLHSSQYPSFNPGILKGRLTSANLSASLTAFDPSSAKDTQCSTRRMSEPAVNVAVMSSSSTLPKIHRNNLADPFLSLPLPLLSLLLHLEDTSEGWMSDRGIDRAEVNAMYRIRKREERERERANKRKKQKEKLKAKKNKSAKKKELNRSKVVANDTNKSHLNDSECKPDSVNQTVSNLNEDSIKSIHKFNSSLNDPLSGPPSFARFIDRITRRRKEQAYFMGKQKKKAKNRKVKKIVTHKNIITKQIDSKNGDKSSVKNEENICEEGNDVFPFEKRHHISCDRKKRDSENEVKSDNSKQAVCSLNSSLLSSTPLSPQSLSIHSTQQTTSSSSSSAQKPSSPPSLSINPVPLASTPISVVSAASSSQKDTTTFHPVSSSISSYSFNSSPQLSSSKTLSSTAACSATHTNSLLPQLQISSFNSALSSPLSSSDYISPSSSAPNSKEMQHPEFSATIPKTSSHRPPALSMSLSPRLSSSCTLSSPAALTRSSSFLPSVNSPPLSSFSSSSPFLHSSPFPVSSALSSSSSSSSTSSATSATSSISSSHFLPDLKPSTASKFVSSSPTANFTSPSTSAFSPRSRPTPRQHKRYEEIDEYSAINRQKEKEKEEEKKKERERRKELLDVEREREIKQKQEKEKERKKEREEKSGGHLITGKRKIANPTALPDSPLTGVPLAANSADGVDAQDDAGFAFRVTSVVRTFGGTASSSPCSARST
eukprot:MONOS_11488.2-p1 / transcript=MONOS_11488.2 / gene=MONOS_11488 / organism=Monocercomonoides_exilis_PA203 / gene_product=unspecified product / transcript_product=unspecified product / location=Mono_scaffold00579:31303-36001(+) / protein_length=1486 / sequence_SO=supercontig / SO=protein_coding / is_pseudo=false